MSTQQPPAAPAPAGPAPAGASSASTALQVLDGAVDVVAGVASAVLVTTAAGLGFVGQAWVADRPRRQFKRTLRRNRWRYARKGDWRRTAVRIESVFVVGWLIGRSLVRVAIGIRPTWRAARLTAAAGWQAGVMGAQARRAARRGYSAPPSSGPGPAPTGPMPGSSPTGAGPGPGAASGAGPGAAPASGSPGTAPGAGSGQAQRPAPIPVTVEARPLCNWLQADGRFCAVPLADGELFCAEHGTPADPARFAGTTAPDPTSRRWDRQPETEADTRFFDLRESGYTGWIDQDGYAVDGPPLGAPVTVTATVLALPPRPGADGYEPVAGEIDGEIDPADAAVPCPMCDGSGCDHCDNGQVPAWSVDPAHGVIPAHGEQPVRPTIPGAALAPVPAATVAAPTGRNHPMSSSTVATSGSTTGQGLIATDLQTVSDLRLEAQRATTVIEQFELLGKQIRAWAAGLPDRVGAADFGTKKITTAVNGVSEHQTKAGALREQIGLLDKACQEALGLGEQMAAQRAEGRTAAYTPQ